MSDDCCPTESDTSESDLLVCPKCETEARSVSYETLYHQLEPFKARDVTPEKTYGVCREQSCSVLYFSSDHEQSWETSDVRTTVGFKRSENDPPHPVCYCFGYTEENIADEIEETGKSTVVEWITERVQADECACEYKNPTGQCCLGDVREAVDKAIK
jgi:hypothetical protein